jgi:uncharacterized phage infection (PIP) family protein YhgE
MDEETAKEVADLQNNLEALLGRKRKREEAALEEENKGLKEEIASLQEQNRYLKVENTCIEERITSLEEGNTSLKDENKSLKDENKSLKDENKHLTQLLTSSIQRCSQTNQRLAEVKKSNQELDTDNQALEKDFKQGTRSKLLQKHICELRRKEVASQARIIEVLEEEARLLKVENDSLQARVERSEKYEIASKKAVLDLKT